jgi:alpha-tubulin suppressor-like RCC1 family protein
VSHHQQGQCTIKETNRKTCLLDLCDYGAGDNADSGDGNSRTDHMVFEVIVQAGKKDSSTPFIASHNNFVIIAVTTSVRDDALRILTIHLQREWRDQQQSL